jgi:hypothetical protein
MKLKIAGFSLNVERKKSYFSNREKFREIGETE